MSILREEKAQLSERTCQQAGSPGRSASVCARALLCAQLVQQRKLVIQLRLMTYLLKLGLQVKQAEDGAGVQHTFIR